MLKFKKKSVAKRLIYILLIKSFVFQLDNVMLLKYISVIFYSQIIAHDVKPGSGTSVENFRTTNVDNS